MAAISGEKKEKYSTSLRLYGTDHLQASFSVWMAGILRRNKNVMSYFHHSDVWKQQQHECDTILVETRNFLIIEMFIKSQIGENVIYLVSNWIGD